MMSFIHLNPSWPRFVWDSARLAAPVAQVHHRQGMLLGRMAALGFAPRTETGLVMLTRDVVTTSAIEGETLDPALVRSSIARRLGLDVAGVPNASRNVEGVVELMLDATRRCQEPLTSGRLFAWHAALFPTGRSGMARITIGAWRQPEHDPMQVVSGRLGRERVHFEAPGAVRVPAEMAAFIAWFNAPPSMDLVLASGMAHLWFVTIHPFDDGNGRIARALADMMLARADGTPERFYSMSSQIEAERAEYYLQLERAQRNGMDITRWLEWYLACLGRALDAAEAYTRDVLRRTRIWERLHQRGLNERQRTVLARLLDGFEGNLTNAKYATLAKCSADSALRDIRALLEWGVLVKNGEGGRSTSYRLGALDATSD